jgi:hypothetical protein
MPTARNLAGALATLATPLLLLSLWSWVKAAPVHQGFRQPAVALELAQTPADVAALAGTPARQAWFRSGVVFDFLVIAFYGLFYLALAAALALRPFRLAIWLAALGAVFAAAGALFDLLENFRLFALLDVPSTAPVMPARLADLSAATLWKWRALFLALLFLSANFFGTERRWHNAVGALYVATGAIGLWGVVHHSPAIEVGFVLMLVGMIAVAPAWFPRRLPS